MFQSQVLSIVTVPPFGCKSLTSAVRNKGALHSASLRAPAFSYFKTFWLVGSDCIPIICARLRLEELTVVQSDVSLWNVSRRNDVSEHHCFRAFLLDLFNNAQ